MTVAPFFFLSRAEFCRKVWHPARRGGGPDTIRMILSNNIVILHGILEPIYHIYQTD